MFLHEKKPQYLFILQYFLIGTFFLYVNILMPIAGEDFDLMPWDYNSAPISFLDKVNFVFQSVVNDALNWNIRVGEALTIMIGAFPPIIFDILNTINYIWLTILLFIIGFIRFPEWKNQSDLFALFLINFQIIVLLPLLGQVFFWQAGTGNHNWGVTILLSFIIPFLLISRAEIKYDNVLILSLLIIYGFFAGLTIENGVVIVIVALLILLLYLIRKNQFDLKYLYPILSFIIGAFVLLFSPSTSNRRNYYASIDIDSGIGYPQIFISRYLRINHDLISYSWILLILFFSSLFIFLILAFYKKSQKHDSIQYEDYKKSIIKILLNIVLILFYRFNSCSDTIPKRPVKSILVILVRID